MHAHLLGQFLERVRGLHGVAGVGDDLLIDAVLRRVVPDAVPLVVAGGKAARGGVVHGRLAVEALAVGQQRDERIERGQHVAGLVARVQVAHRAHAGQRAARGHAGGDAVALAASHDVADEGVLRGVLHHPFLVGDVAAGGQRDGLGLDVDDGTVLGGEACARDGAGPVGDEGLEGGLEQVFGAGLGDLLVHEVELVLHGAQAVLGEERLVVRALAKRLEVIAPVVVHLVDELAAPRLQKHRALEAGLVALVVGGELLADLVGAAVLIRALLFGELGRGAHLAGRRVDGVAAERGVLLHDEHLLASGCRVDGREHARDARAHDEHVHFLAEVHVGVAYGHGGRGGGGVLGSSFGRAAQAHASGDCGQGARGAQGAELTTVHFHPYSPSSL